MLESVDPSVARGQDATMLHTILDITAERIGSELGRDPGIEEDLRRLLGRGYLEIGDFNRAEEMHRAALTINEKVHGRDSLETAASLNSLGLAFVSHGKWSEAGAYIEEALAIRRRKLGSNDTEVADSISGLAAVS